MESPFPGVLSGDVSVFDKPKYNGFANQAKSPFIITVSGQKVEFINPKPEQINVHDIAWHLARTTRYAGHTLGWYSNAEHCVLAMSLIDPKEQRLRKFMLTHDAAEYVFGDMPSPVKVLCPEYDRLIGNFENFLNLHLIGSLPTDEEAKFMKDIDNRLCATEMKYMRFNPDEAIRHEPYPEGHVKFFCWDWPEAYATWMAAYRELFRVQ